MKVLMINVVCGIRSTGRICVDIATRLEQQGHEVKIAYGRENVPTQYQKYSVRIGNIVDIKKHCIKARIVDGCGFGSKEATEKFIEWLEEYNPDIIHLHNIHGYYINIEVLFNYLRTCKSKIIWTLHDCWPFTGHAAYCEAANCERWKAGCYDCSKRSDYPTSFTDNSKKNWLRKKELFTGIPNLQIVTPSQWLADLVKESFLSEYKVSVIHNGIDTNMFKPVESDIKKKLGIEDKRMVLGVAALWEKRKGLYDFYELSRQLNDNHRIVLVGLPRNKIIELPDNMIGIERTNSVQELAELYSSAYVYVNPTYEDNYPTTNLESIACGTPVISYNTGGCAESASIYGKVVVKGDVLGIKQLICENDLETWSRDLNREETICIDSMIDKYMYIYYGVKT